MTARERRVGVAISVAAAPNVEATCDIAPATLLTATGPVIRPRFFEEMGLGDLDSDAALRLDGRRAD